MFVVNMGDYQIEASNLPAHDYDEYDAAATYFVGSMVSYNGRNYECRVDSTIAIEPAVDSANWVDVEAVNRLKPFDEFTNTKASNAESITYSIRVPGILNSVSLFQVQAASIDISVVDDYEGEIYAKTINMSDAAVDNFYDFLFTSYTTRDVLVLNDLPNYGNMVLNISINNPGFIAEVGRLHFGWIKRVMGTDWGFNLSLNDFSEFEQDEFGNTQLTPRAYSDHLGLKGDVPTINHMQMYRYLASLRGKPHVFAVDESLPENAVYAVISDLTFTPNSRLNTNCDIKLKGLV